jgi:hypothetical protein
MLVMDRNNKNEDDYVDPLKDVQQLVNEIQSILHEIQSILHKKYGYSVDHMRVQVPLRLDPRKIADLVVFDETSLHY